MFINHLYRLPIICGILLFTCVVSVHSAKAQVVLSPAPSSRLLRSWLRLCGCGLFSFVLALAGCTSATTPEEGAVIDDGQQVTVNMGGLMAGPQLGVVIDEQLVVLDVESGSTAQQAGILPGDRLLALAGVGIADHRQQVKELIWYFAEGSAPLPLTLVRDGVEMTLAITPVPPMNPGPFDTPPPTVTPVWPPNDYF